MKPFHMILLFCMAHLQAFGQSNSSIPDFNFGFEKTIAGQTLPDNWFNWSAANGYKITRDSITKHGGKNAMCIEATANRSADNPFGCIACKIPAIYVGAKITVSAYMKIKNIKDGSIGLLLRIDDQSNILAFDNMQQKNIQGTSDWTKYTVELTYPADAETIYIGALCSGTGQLWVDDFELLIDGKELQHAKLKPISSYNADKDHAFDTGSGIQTLPLAETAVNNLDLLCKVWGFLKYYHPAITAGNYNWDNELFRFLPKYITVKNETERDALLYQWIDELGPFEAGKPLKKNLDQPYLPADLEWIANTHLSSALKDQLKKIQSAERTTKSYYIKMAEGVGFPLFRNENAYAEMKYPDAGFRLLCIYRYWNMIQYFFPYRDLIDEDWNKVPKEFIPKFLNAKNETDYNLTTLELIGRIHDTHANLWMQTPWMDSTKGRNYAAASCRFIDNKAVISSFHDAILGTESGLQGGDIITHINNRPVEEIVAERLKYTPASNLPTQLRDMGENLLRTNDTSLQVTFLRDGIRHTQTVKAYGTDQINIYSKYDKVDTCFKLLTPDIAYLYLGKIQSSYLDNIMKTVNTTKGLIIDLRCYPSDFVVFNLGKYLMPKSIPFVKFTNGNIIEPGEFTVAMQLSVGEKNKNYYKGKVIILVDENTQSQAEYTTMAFRVAPRAMVIGSTTAGADGNVSEIYLPGGLYTMISGIGVYYPDGRGTQRVGIQPDLEMRPTIDGIKNNKDELLEKAIEIINQR